MRTRSTLALAALLLATTAACGAETDADSEATSPSESASESPSASPSPQPMPTAAPAAEGEVRTDGVVTVIDAGSPQLCLGAVAMSLPPQCQGLSLLGWKWADHPGYDERAGVRWGSYAVTGTWDGTSFTVTSAIPLDSYDPETPEPELPDLSTPCPEPEGGWRVLKPAKTTTATMEATFTEASRLPGFAEAWLDTSLDTSKTPGSDDPTKVIINVAVTEDLSGAKATLRKVWGGALCVTPAKYTEAQLTTMATELQQLPGVLSTSASRDLVEATVVYDDGSLQEWADASYGEGRIEISSALLPVE